MPKFDKAAHPTALEMHKECMKDPEYAEKWNTLTAALFGTLADIPEEALSDHSDDNQ